jgi:hypothetical protein
MKVVTVINDENHFGFSLLKLSCILNNLDLVVLVSSAKDFKSNRIKDDLLKDYLDKKGNEEEIILFTDGNDAIFLATEEEVLTKYRKAGKELLFSSETSCWPDTSLAGQYPDTGPSPYKFLNSGGFIGSAGTIRELMEDDSFDIGNFKKSNQYVWTKRLFRNPERIGLDTGCEIFHTFSPEIGNNYLPKGLDVNYLPYYICMKKWFGSNFLVQDGRLFSKITESWPCHAHFNGYSKWLIDHDIINMVFSSVPDAKPAQYLYEEN